MPGSAQAWHGFDPPSPRVAAVWAQAAAYLDGRIHAAPEQKPGRAPDMSVEAADAMKAVMADVRDVAAGWAQLRELVNGRVTWSESNYGDVDRLVRGLLKKVTRVGCVLLICVFV